MNIQGSSSTYNIFHKTEYVSQQELEKKKSSVAGSATIYKESYEEQLREAGVFSLE